MLLSLRNLYMDICSNNSIIGALWMALDADVDVGRPNSIRSTSNAGSLLPCTQLVYCIRQQHLYSHMEAECSAPSARFPGYLPNQPNLDGSSNNTSGGGGVTAAMPPVRGGAGAKSGGTLREQSAASGSVGGDANSSNPASAGHGRPSRVSAAIALASFNWTDDAIVEVSEPRWLCVYGKFWGELQCLTPAIT